MQSVIAETGLTITNPLVLYRALVATKKIEADPAQHRLAIHLQKLYHRLKDYEPAIEYKHRLDQISQTVGTSAAYGPKADDAVEEESPQRLTFWDRFKQEKVKTDSLALTRAFTSHEAAMGMDSPQGLLLYGEVGTGKSFLVDLLAESLPSRKKRRYHFNTFMLDTFARLEQQRIQWTMQQQVGRSHGLENEHTLLSLARDMVVSSPILFLDEFQLPDKASSKILSNLFTSFFQLGGVLIATSNRMPEELSKASGVEFAAPSISNGTIGFSGLRRLFGSGAEDVGKGMFARQSDFTQFLEVLKARCETWNMESKTDFRRRDSSSFLRTASSSRNESELRDRESGFGSLATEHHTSDGFNADPDRAYDNPTEEDISLPPFFFCKSSDVLSGDSLKEESIWHASILQAVSPTNVSLDELSWQTEVLNVYGRKVQVPKALNGACMWTFDQLCGSYLGPADYITLASTYRTIIIDEVPVLNFLQKNEARRLITLLDALYEARCRLLIRAEAGPDEIFFPDARGLNRSSDSKDGNGGVLQGLNDDGVYAETLSEIYQDQTMPFRPNISSYNSNVPEEYLANSTSTRRHGAHPATRSVLADEDADFGPVYGAGRSAGASSFDPAEEDRLRLATQAGPNFQQTGAFTGEDEKFAYKRAESRLWELCSRRWWENATGENWWKPLSKEFRTWEHDADAVLASGTKLDEAEIEREREKIFRHGASPFRTHQEPPPKIPWTHAWGMMEWGKKAGAWGKGAKVAEERLEEKRKEREMMDRIHTKPRP